MTEPGFVVSEYIRRFRQEKPSSEIERRVNKEDFWWLTDDVRGSNESPHPVPNKALSNEENSLICSDFNISSIKSAKSAESALSSREIPMDVSIDVTASSQCDVILARCNELLNQYRIQDEDPPNDDVSAVFDGLLVDRCCDNRRHRSRTSSGDQISSPRNSDTSCTLDSSFLNHALEYVGGCAGKLDRGEFSHASISKNNYCDNHLPYHEADDADHDDDVASSFLFISPSSSACSSYSHKHGRLHGSGERGSTESDEPERIGEVPRSSSAESGRVPLSVPLSLLEPAQTPAPLTTVGYVSKNFHSKKASVDLCVVEPFLWDQRVSDLWVQLQAIRAKREEFQLQRNNCTGAS